MNQLKNIDLNNSIIKIQESSDSEGSITEKIKDIKKDFIDTENFEDFLSKNNKKINPNFNKFEGIDGNLNNKKNPFIEANNEINNQKNESSNNSIEMKLKENIPLSNKLKKILIILIIQMPKK